MIDVTAECAGITPEQMAQMQANNVSISDIKKSFRAGFVQSCAQSSGSSAVCNCVYEKAVADFTDDDFIQINQASQQVLDRFMNNVQAHVEECR